MAQEGLDQTRHAFEAGGDLSGDQYNFVTGADADDQVDVVGSAGALGFVLVDKPDAAGEVATVVLAGKAKVEAGETIDAFDKIASNDSGEAVTATTGDTVLGVALEDASDGDIFKFMVGGFDQLN